VTSSGGRLSVHGTAEVTSQPTDFLSAFARRIETGLLRGASPSRNAYVVVRHTDNELSFRAATWWTAINVGLNDVELAVGADRRARYVVSYGRWTAYGVLLGAVIGLILIVFLATYDVRAYLLESPSSMIPGLSLDQNVAIGWGMAVFWGFVFPWVLAALHRRPLRTLMNRLIAEADAAAGR
jgi:hypothetical protein